MTTPKSVEALLRQAGDYLASDYDSTTRMVRKLRDALADAQKEMVWLREQAATGVMRGKKAEAALRAAPHDSGCWMASGRNGNGCTCWKSRYSA